MSLILWDLLPRRKGFLQETERSENARAFKPARTAVEWIDVSNCTRQQFQWVQIIVRRILGHDLRIKPIVDDRTAQRRQLNAQLMFATGDRMHPVQGLRAVPVN